MEFKMELTKLYNTMGTIETKGKDTLVMADCLRFLENLINNVPVPEENKLNDSEIEK